MGDLDVVPIGAADLADWVGRRCRTTTAACGRGATWARLERRPAGHLLTDAETVEQGKIDAIGRAQADGLVAPGRPFDVMAMVIAMSMAWSPVSNVYAATSDEPASEHERRRAFLRATVERAFTPDAG